MKKAHLFHIIDPSPWPFLSSINIFNMFLGCIYCFNAKKIGCTIIIYSLVSLFLIAFLWWRDVVREGTYEGKHTLVVQKGLKLGMILFIVSEVMFFVSFFWAYFHTALAPSIQLGSNWPPYGICVFNYADVPFLNTLILLTSGVLVTWTHKEIMNKNSLKKSKAIFSLLMTIILAVIFTIFQVYEYYEASFSIADSAYGSVFFMSTGFHGLHVIIGTLFLSVCLIRLILYHFAKNHHIGLILAIWYWHFVDVVWLVLYIVVYWWGEISLSPEILEIPYIWTHISKETYEGLMDGWFQEKEVWGVQLISTRHSRVPEILIAKGWETKTALLRHLESFRIVTLDMCAWLEEKLGNNGIWLVVEKTPTRPNIPSATYVLENRIDKEAVLKQIDKWQIVSWDWKPEYFKTNRILKIGGVYEALNLNDWVNNDDKLWVILDKYTQELSILNTIEAKVKIFENIERWEIISIDGYNWFMFDNGEALHYYITQTLEQGLELDNGGWVVSLNSTDTKVVISEIENKKIMLENRDISNIESINNYIEAIRDTIIREINEFINNTEDDWVVAKIHGPEDEVIKTGSRADKIKVLQNLDIYSIISVDWNEWLISLYKEELINDESKVWIIREKPWPEPHEWVVVQGKEQKIWALNNREFWKIVSLDGEVWIRGREQCVVKRLVADVSSVGNSNVGNSVVENIALIETKYKCKLDELDDLVHRDNIALIETKYKWKLDALDDLVHRENKDKYVIEEVSWLGKLLKKNLEVMTAKPVKSAITYEDHVDSVPWEWLISEMRDELRVLKKESMKTDDWFQEVYLKLIDEWTKELDALEAQDKGYMSVESWFESSEMYKYRIELKKKFLKRLRGLHYMILKLQVVEKTEDCLRENLEIPEEWKKTQREVIDRIGIEVYLDALYTNSKAKEPHEAMVEELYEEWMYGQKRTDKPNRKWDEWHK